MGFYHSRKEAKRKKKAANPKNPCPYGHRFAVDIGRKRACEKLCMKWDDCLEEEKRLRTGKPEPKVDPKNPCPNGYRFGAEFGGHKDCEFNGRCWLYDACSQQLDLLSKASYADAMALMPELFKKEYRGHLTNMTDGVVHAMRDYCKSHEICLSNSVDFIEHEHSF